MTLCGLINYYRRFDGACYLHLQGKGRGVDPEDGVSKLIEIIGTYLSIYTES